MGKANADSEAIKRFAKQVDTYVSQQQAIIRKLRSQYNSVGSQWKDLQYQKFGETLAELEKSIKKQEPAFKDYSKRLKKKAEQIENYLA